MLKNQNLNKFNIKLKNESEHVWNIYLKRSYLI